MWLFMLCISQQQTIMLFLVLYHVAGCPRPSVPVGGSISPFTATNEGVEIVYGCGAGFQPQENRTATCSNGVWTPDPGQWQCTGAWELTLSMLY